MNHPGEDRRRPMIVLPISASFVFAGFGEQFQMHRKPRVVIVKNELLGAAVAP